MEDDSDHSGTETSSLEVSGHEKDEEEYLGVNWNHHRICKSLESGEGWAIIPMAKEKTIQTIQTLLSKPNMRSMIPFENIFAVEQKGTRIPSMDAYRKQWVVIARNCHKELAPLIKAIRIINDEVRKSFEVILKIPSCELISDNSTILWSDEHAKKQAIHIDFPNHSWDDGLKKAIFIVEVPIIGSASLFLYPTATSFFRRLHRYEPFVILEANCIETEVKIPSGNMLVFRSEVAHGGAVPTSSNFRLHFVFRMKDVEKPTDNRTYLFLRQDMKRIHKKDEELFLRNVRQKCQENTALANECLQILKEMEQ